MRFPDLSRAVRLAWILTGLMWFVWLGVEDRGVVLVLLLGTSISVSASITGLERWGKGRILSGRLWWTSWLGFGISGAIGMGPLALLLISVKVSLHSHELPDFNLSHVLQVIDVWPVWGLGMLIVALGLGVLARAQIE